MYTAANETTKVQNHQGILNTKMFDKDSVVLAGIADEKVCQFCVRPFQLKKMGKLRFKHIYICQCCFDIKDYSIFFMQSMY